MVVVVKSSEAGFFTETITGDVKAASFTLSNLQNDAGTFVNLSGSNNWQSADAISGSSISTQFTSDLLPVKASFGQIETVQVSTVALFRYDDDQEVAICTIDFGQTLTTDALYDEQSQGVGWSTNLAQDMSDLIKTEGLKFIGSNNTDIFEPSNEPLSYDKTTIIRLKDGDDHATGTIGDDLMHGGAGDDQMYDDGGHNILKGGSGNDRIEFGNDPTGNSGFGNSGNDELISGSASDTLSGGSGHDTLSGGKGDDHLRGQSGRDTLYGGDGDDTLEGGKGMDFLQGGKGNDILTGGAGRDTFQFFQNTDGDNTITDFEIGKDYISLPDIDADFSIIDMVQDGDNTLIKSPSKEFSIKLENIDIDDLDEDDFVF